MTSMGMLRRRLIGRSACALALAAATAPAVAAEPDAGRVNAVDEIIVTATRREEALKDVPLAISAISAQEVQRERILDFKDVVTRVPGTTFIPIKGSTYATPQIRGQTTTNESPALDAPVVVFQDDLYYGSSAALNADFFDIEQIAVLKGPQGTTFGRNVVGGAVQVTSRAPQMRDSNAEVILTAGNYSLLTTQGFVNHAFRDDLSGRLSFSMRKRDGYVKNYFNGSRVDDANVLSGRLQLRYTPRDDLDVLLSVSHTYQDNVGRPERAVGPLSIAALARQQQFAPNPRSVYLDDNGEDKRQLYAALLKVEWLNPLGELTSITGFHSLHGLYDADIDLQPIQMYGHGPRFASNFNQERFYSQEFRLVSPAGRRVDFVLGVYGELQHLYKKIDLTFATQNVTGTGECNPRTNPNGNWFFACAVPAFRAGMLPANTNQVVDVASLAPYAELRWNITDQLALTVGGRYSYVSKEGVTQHENPSPFYGAAFVVPFDDSWTSFTPRVIVSWKPSEDLMLYVSRSDGFKSGGFSATMNTAAQSSRPLKPEDSVSYETGMKGWFFDRRLSLDVAAYKANTKNLQVKTLVSGRFLETNAGEVEVKGVEVDLLARPVENLRLGVRYAYTDARYVSFPGCTSGNVDCTGERLPWTPKNDLLFTAEYTWPAFQGELTASASLKYADPYPVTAVNADARYGRPLTEQDGILDAYVVYQPNDARWSLQVWGKNLTDELYAPYAANYYFMVMTTAEVASGIPRDVAKLAFAPPRTFGVTLNIRFD